GVDVDHLVVVVETLHRADGDAVGIAATAAIVGDDGRHGASPRLARVRRRAAGTDARIGRGGVRRTIGKRPAMSGMVSGTVGLRKTGREREGTASAGACPRSLLTR